MIRFLGYSRIDGHQVFYLPAGGEDDIFLSEVKKQGKYSISNIQVEKDGTIDDIVGEVFGFYGGRFGIGVRSQFRLIPGHPLSNDYFFHCPGIIKSESVPNVIRYDDIEKMNIDGRFVKLFRDVRSPNINLLPNSMLKEELKQDVDLFTRRVVRREKLIKLNDEVRED